MTTTPVAPSTTSDLDAPPATPDFGPATRLTCRECGTSYSLGAAYACVECFGPLEVGYDFSGVSRALIESGPQSMWRYSCLLPVASYAGSERNLNPGLTRLVRADNLAKALGITGTLWVKDDSGNPTHSFKDRVVAVAQSAARRLGLGTIACASTGNLANAVAAAAARAGQDSVVVIPSNLEDGKVITTAAYGGVLLAVDGNYDDVNRLCSELVGDPADRRLGLRQRQPPALLRRGLEDRGLRDRGAARLAPAAAGRRSDRLGIAAHQGGQGVSRVRVARPRRGDTVEGLRCAGDRVLPGVAGVP